MTIEDDLEILRSQAKLIVDIAEPDHKEAATNALNHLLRVFSYEGAAYITGIEEMMLTLGNYLALLDSKAGVELNHLGNMCATEIEATSVDAFLSEYGIHTTQIEENSTIYEQFRSGHLENDQVLKWLVKK